VLFSFKKYLLENMNGPILIHLLGFVAKTAVVTQQLIRYSKLYNDILFVTKNLFNMLTTGKKF